MFANSTLPCTCQLWLVLQAWKDLLQNTVEDSMPAALSLEQESPVLHVSTCSFHCRSLHCFCANNLCWSFLCYSNHCQSDHCFSATHCQMLHCSTGDMQQALLVLTLHSCLHATDSVNPGNKKVSSPTAFISSQLCLLLFLLPI